MQIFYLSLYLAAQMLVGYRTDTQMPDVILVSDSYLQEKFCKKECDLKGIYAGGGRVYMSEELNMRGNQIDGSILLHEFVHFLQKERDRYEFKDLDCQQYMALEKEAYLVQFRYLNNLGIDTPNFSPASFTCN